MDQVICDPETMTINDTVVIHDYNKILDILQVHCQVNKLTITGLACKVNIQPNTLELIEIGDIELDTGKTRNLIISGKTKITPKLWAQISRVPYKHFGERTTGPVEYLAAAQKITFSCSRMYFDARFLCERVSHIELNIDRSSIDHESVLGIILGLQNNPGKSLSVRAEEYREPLTKVLGLLVLLSVSLSRFELITTEKIHRDIIGLVLRLDTTELSFPKSKIPMRKFMECGRYSKVDAMGTIGQYKKNTKS